MAKPRKRSRQSLPPFQELAHHELHPESIQRLPLAYCEARGVVILGQVGEDSSQSISLGVTRQDGGAVCDELARSWGRAFVPVRISTFELERALDVGFRGAPVDAGEDHSVPLHHPPVDATAPPSEILDDILLHAIEQHASDVHIEVYRNDTDVRLRVDGVLHQLTTPLSPENVAAVVSRIKVLASLDIAERRRPQDGRFRLRIEGRTPSELIDMRVSILPGPFGEDVVLRLLDRNMGILPLRDLGFADAEHERFAQLIANPEGCIFVTGPTGSGKTTTLYSALAAVRSDTRKILSVEDPIEYFLEKVNQKQVTANMSMADIARAFLRQDPDVMLIGEVRDRDTAQTAASAATTGHLVLSTLHTTDSFGAIARLRTLGLDGDVISNSLLAAIAQRLARRVCPACAETVRADGRDAELLERFDLPLDVRRGQGCEQCLQTGYRGRVGVFELLTVDESLRDALIADTPTSEIRVRCEGRGFRTMLHDGIDKVAQGLTTLDELRRVLPYRAFAQSETDKR